MYIILVSIVTPSLNSEKYIEETIVSVANQSYSDIEHIIVDGGSIDGTLSIIKKYSHLKLIVDKDESMYQAINKGLKLAGGQICAYLNSDDIYYNNTIDFVVNFFKTNRNFMLLYGNMDFIDSNGCYLYTFRYPEFNIKKFISYKASYIPQPAAFWRKDIHNEIGYFDERFKLSGDKDFFIRVGLKYQVKKVNCVLAAQRIHEEALTYRSNINKERSLTSIKEYEARLINDKYKTSLNQLSLLFGNLAVWLNIKLLNWPVYIKRVSMQFSKYRFYKGAK